MERVRDLETSNRNNNMDLSAEKLYLEACNALRHYSNSVMQVRTWTIVQGFTILTAIYFLVTRTNYIYSLILSVFGLILTFILNILQSNYGMHHEALLHYVVTLEEGNGPWSVYKLNRDARLQRRYYKLAIWSGPVLLLSMSMGIALVYSIIELCR